MFVNVCSCDIPSETELAERVAFPRFLSLPAPPWLPTHRSEVLRHVQNWAVSMTSW